MRFTLPRIITLLAAFALCAPAAHALEVALVLSQKGGAHAQFAEALNATAGGSAGLRLVNAGNLEDGVDEGLLQRADLILAAGAPAAEAVLRAHARPTLAVLLAHSQFHSLRDRHPGATLSAIVLDQPPARHLALVRAVLPKAGRLGVLLGPDTAALESELAAAGAVGGPGLVSRQVSTAAELLPALERVLESSDALLALPDPLVSGPAAARAILLTSYRYRRPVFAFSRAYVDAGALAAVFSNPGDIARDVGDWLRQQPGTPPRLPAARSPRHFDVAINRQVARALNLDVPDEATVLARIRAQEQP